MQRSDFNYTLLDDLIAHYPLPERTSSRLLHLNKNTSEITHHLFHTLSTFLKPGDVMIFNDTKVIPARLFGAKTSGGRVEIFIERLLPAGQLLAHLKASHAPKPGAVVRLDAGGECTVLDRHHDQFILQYHGEDPIETVLDRAGEIPIPHYFKRDASEIDKTRYQTVYAKHPGAVAAPTAGLHFDEAFLDALKQQGILLGFVTLHVGAGTFQPVRVENLAEHHMHSEWINVPAETCELIHAAKIRGNRVIAIGTTAVRSLETAARTGTLSPYQGETNLFIYPGYTFQCVDAILTNFHLPESTLLMLVCAFAGYASVMAAYQAAIASNYRFFSYGDAMLIA